MWTSHKTSNNITIKFNQNCVILWLRRHTSIPDILDSGKASGPPSSHVIHPDHTTDRLQAARRTTRGASSNRETGAEGEAEAEDDLQLSGSQQLHSLQPNKSFKLGNIFPVGSSSRMYTPKCAKRNVIKCLLCLSRGHVRAQAKERRGWRQHWHHFSIQVLCSRCFYSCPAEFSGLNQYAATKINVILVKTQIYL